MKNNLNVQKTAIVSECGQYRYNLTRTWNAKLPDMIFIMLNPSTADGFSDDPTIRRCIGFANRENFGGIQVYNLFALRSTNPKELRNSSDPVGPLNDAYLMGITKTTSSVICAWGEYGRYMNRDDQVLSMLARNNVRIECLGDKPRHPLYIKSDQPLKLFTPVR